MIGGRLESVFCGETRHLVGSGRVRQPSASSGLDFGVSRFGVSHGCGTKTVANAKTAHLPNPRSKTGRCTERLTYRRLAGQADHGVVAGFEARLDLTEAVAPNQTLQDAGATKVRVVGGDHVLLAFCGT
ncbi:hypothetical protein Pla52n_20710 [Stieleria varia]|uniref:Uncharacterized protein n=1 Tax=Stieleria varia TaxID=2528005 RepID=A0A5C6B379_9BACT|nr:hypothetical protein Pla52n_20710 [Stieleria varia]